jgi:NitT/TauT family transport system substrate-binding protein
MLNLATKLAIVAIIAIVAVAGVFAVLSLTTSKPSSQPQPLTAVKFILNFGAIDGQHVPYFVALDKGWYRDEGLDVQIIPGRNSPYATQQVGAGNADIGLATADVIVAARAQGLPVKAVYPIFQTSPAGIAALTSAKITQPSDLIGKKVGAFVGGTQDLQFDILLQKLNIDSSKIQKINTGFDVVSPLATGQVDAVQMWSTNLPDYKTARMNVTYFLFKDYGINYYSLSIFSNDNFISQNPNILQKFVSVTQRAIDWVSQHPGEAVDSTMKYTAFKLPTTSSLLFDKLEEALKLMKPQGVTSAQMTEQSWTDLQDLLLKFGKIKEKVPVTSLFTNDFVPKSTT